MTAVRSPFYDLPVKPRRCAIYDAQEEKETDLKLTEVPQKTIVPEALAGEKEEGGTARLAGDARLPEQVTEAADIRFVFSSSALEGTTGERTMF